MYQYNNQKFDLELLITRNEFQSALANFILVSPRAMCHLRTYHILGYVKSKDG